MSPKETAEERQRVWGNYYEELERLERLLRDSACNDKEERALEG